MTKVNIPTSVVTGASLGTTSVQPGTNGAVGGAGGTPIESGLNAAARGDAPARAAVIRTLIVLDDTWINYSYPARIRAIDPTALSVIIRNRGAVNIDVAEGTLTDTLNGPSTGWVSVVPGQEAVFTGSQTTKWMRSTTNSTGNYPRVEIETEMAVSA